MRSTRGRQLVSRFFISRFSREVCALRVGPIIKGIRCFGTVQMVGICRKVLSRLVKPSSLCLCLAVTEEPKGDGGKEYTNANANANCDADLRSLREAVGCFLSGWGC
jgi:hypothetical protein